MKAYHYLIKGPIITEKTHTQKEAANKLTFRVDLKANKIEIRKAIEDIFKVKVLGVNTIHLQGQEKEDGQDQGHAPRLEEGRSHPGARGKRSPDSKSYNVAAGPGG